MTVGRAMKPRVLDLYCGAGGAAMGYHRAGLDVVLGVDIEPQPDYPFPFMQADALEVMADLPGSYDLIHASPPCQAYSTMGNRYPRMQPALIAETRGLLESAGARFVIENVAGAVRQLMEPKIRLTGEMFGLRVHRPRWFELGGWMMLQPPVPAAQADAVAVYGKPDGRRLCSRADGSTLSAWGSVEEGAAAMGMDWTRDALGVREAIPPAYTEFIGRQFLEGVWLQEWIGGRTQ